MRKVLYILGQLADSDIDWLAKVGQKVSLKPDYHLIKYGETHPMLYIVLDGELSVQTNTHFELAKIYAGEVLGEMSFVDARPPSANVIVTRDSVLLEISKEILSEKLENDSAFGSRFYKAISIFLSQRMRKTIGRMGYESANDKEEDTSDELDVNALDNVSIAGARFDRLLKILMV